MIFLHILACMHPSMIQEVITPEVPLYRSSEHGQRLFVPVDMGEAGVQYFMIDTGAGVSVLRRDIANQLDLKVEFKPGVLVGISGTNPWTEVTVPSIQIGNRTIENVDFAVDVQGVPTHAGLVPIAGVLGNNIWEDFVMELNYGEEYLKLYDSYTMPTNSQQVRYTSQHMLADMQLWSGEDVKQSLVVNIDTGSSGLLLNRSYVPKLEQNALSSQESIIGVGTENGDGLIDTHYQQITKFALGGLEESIDTTAVLLTPSENPDFISLVGYAILENHKLLFDFQGKKFHMEPSTKDVAPRNLHQEYLKMLLWSGKTVDPLEIINLHFVLQQDDIAMRKLQQQIAKSGDIRYKLVLVEVYLRNGEFQKAIKILEEFKIQELIAEEYIQTLLLAYVQDNQLDKALRITKKLCVEFPDDPTYAIIQMRLWILQEEWALAKKEIFTLSTTLDPNMFDVEKAIIALSTGDITSTITYLRQDIQRNPLGSPSLWFLQRVAKGTEYQKIAEQTLHQMQSVENSRQASLDFLAAAYWEIGETENARRISQKGKLRNCDNMMEKDAVSNCNAWFDALVQKDISEHIFIMENIVQNNPGRADYMDTLAVLYRANGEIAKSQKLSKKAMLLSGIDPYMLWQSLSEK